MISCISSRLFIMLPHVFHGPVKCFPVIDLFQIAGKVEMIFIPQLIQQLLPVPAFIACQKIVERKLPHPVSGQVIDARSDQPYRSFFDLVQHPHGFPVYRQGGIAGGNDPGSRDPSHVGVGDLQ